MCEEGVQTSIKIQKEKDSLYIRKKEENLINIYNDSDNINTNINNKNLKISKSSDTDLVNIGNETEEILNEHNTNTNNIFIIGFLIYINKILVTGMKKSIIKILIIFLLIIILMN